MELQERKEQKKNCDFKSNQITPSRAIQGLFLLYFHALIAWQLAIAANIKNKTRNGAIYCTLHIYV